ncbi:MAG: MBL fold metallo-hydrolase [Spirochaetia bacterium]|jgi:L-ascorbate metabolism protein UlaG (beta-lactamase superfamily)|nr:MBL fold metallo-hydrolase [Spirochaetia bacterium]
MKLTYIHHSSFLVETESASLLFDYTEGELPSFAVDKSLYIFSTHRHSDHFSEKIFSLGKDVEKISYLLSFDIAKERIPQALEKDAHILEANSTYQVGDLKIHTFKSTDEGIALVIEIEGKTLYYAGDLNHWHWEGEPDWWNLQMAKDYLAEVEKLPTKFDLAFVPVDPRLGKSFGLGAEELLAHSDVSLLVPMHFWSDFSVCGKLQETTDTQVLQIMHKNQTWRLS